MKTDELSKVAKLLGEENEKKLKDSITDLLIERVQEDLDEMCTYLIDFDELLDEVRKEVKTVIKEKMLKAYLEKAEKKFTELFEKHGEEKM